MVDPEAVQEYDANLQLFEDGMIEKLTAAKPQEQVCSHMPMRDSLVLRLWGNTEQLLSCVFTAILRWDDPRGSIALYFLPRRIH